MIEENPRKIRTMIYEHLFEGDLELFPPSPGGHDAHQTWPVCFEVGEACPERGTGLRVLGFWGEWPAKHRGCSAREFEVD